MKKGTVYKAKNTKEETYFVCGHVMKSIEGVDDFAYGMSITFHGADDDVEFSNDTKKVEVLNDVDMYIMVMNLDMDEIWADALARKIRSKMTPEVLKGKPGQTDAGSTESNLEMRVSILEKQKDELLFMVQNLQKSAEDFKNLELLPSDIERIEEDIRWRVTSVLSWEGYGPLDDTVLRNLIKCKYHDQLKSEFGVKSISQIKHSDIERAMRVVDEFSPNICLCPE